MGDREDIGQSLRAGSLRDGSGGLQGEVERDFVGGDIEYFQSGGE